MIPINNAFSDRANALNTVQTLSGDILSLHARLDKLEAASVKVFGQDRMKTSKIEELRETIRFTEDAKNNAIRQYERIKVTFIFIVYTNLHISLVFWLIFYLALCRKTTNLKCRGLRRRGVVILWPC